MAGMLHHTKVCKEQYSCITRLQLAPTFNHETEDGRLPVSLSVLPTLVLSVDKWYTLEYTQGTLKLYTFLEIWRLENVK